MRLVIADDTALVRDGLARLLQDEGFEVCGRAADATELLALVEQTTPEAAITDIRMPPTQTDEGLVAATEIRARFPQTGVLVLSQYIEVGYALRLIERVTRVAVDIIDYRVTIEDPKTYIRPWTLVLSLTSPRGYELLPYDCHEGNYGLPNILKGERAEDRALEADARRGVYRERRRLLTNPNTPAAEGSER